MPRGEASLTRTDPVVGAVAAYVLANALDRHAPGRPQTRPPLRRHPHQRGHDQDHPAARPLPLPAHPPRPLRQRGTHRRGRPRARLRRRAGAEPAGSPTTKATALLTATPDKNTLPEFTGSAITTILAGLGEVRPEVNRRAGEFAAELRDAHRRVRRTVDQAVRGLTVTPAGDGDILGVYVYLPAQTQGAGQ